MIPRGGKETPVRGGSSKRIVQSSRRDHWRKLGLLPGISQTNGVDFSRMKLENRKLRQKSDLGD